jgi:hypothetical protein
MTDEVVGIAPAAGKQQSREGAGDQPHR